MKKTKWRKKSRVNSIMQSSKGLGLGLSLFFWKRTRLEKVRSSTDLKISVVFEEHSNKQKENLCRYFVFDCKAFLKEEIERWKLEPFMLEIFLFIVLNKNSLNYSYPSVPSSLFLSRKVPMEEFLMHSWSIKLVYQQSMLFNKWTECWCTVDNSGNSFSLIFFLPELLTFWQW